MINVEFESALIMKFPSKSVTAPLYAPASSVIFTPGIGVPFLSEINPVTISFCE